MDNPDLGGTKMGKKSKFTEIPLKPTSKDIMDEVWTDVTIAMVYVDRGKVKTREVKVLKSEMEKDYLDQATQEGRELPESFSLPNEMFQAMVMRSASMMFQSPLVADSTSSNELRLVSPTAVKEVVITVHNLGTVIIA
jgi:hypothetical protein